MRVRLETVTGPERIQGRVAVTPIARSLAVGYGPKGRKDAGGGGDGQAVAVFRCEWPSAVKVSIDGRVSRLRIVDVTRWAQIAIVLVAILWIIKVRGRAATRKERTWTTP